MGKKKKALANLRRKKRSTNAFSFPEWEEKKKGERRREGREGEPSRCIVPQKKRKGKKGRAIAI